MVKPLIPPAVDVLGPYLTTPQSVSSRPGRTGDAAGDGFSWFRDCTDENSEDGTPLGAEFLNNLKAQFITLFQAAGLTFDADELLALAIQSGRVNFGGTSAGTANAPSITLVPQPTDWSALVGADINFVVGITNTGPAALAVSGLAGTKPIVRPGGAALKASDLVAGAVFRGMYDGTSIQMAGITQSTPGSVDVYGVPGTTNWTVPDGVFKIRARVWGAGGGGGSMISADGAGAGGNGGGYAEGVYSVTPGDVIAIVVGAGGAKGTVAGGGTNGLQGGTSSVGSLLSATGGGGGGSGYAGYAALASGIKGVGTGGQINLDGQVAANAYVIGAVYMASAGAGTYNTPGTAASRGNSFKGQQPGGGSSGVAGIVTNATDGADGMVIIEY